MILYQEAFAKLKKIAEEKSTSFLKSTETVATEIQSLSHLMGRILAEKIDSTEAIPSFDNSSMDGFALRSENTIDADAKTPLRFEVIETVFAGKLATQSLSPTQDECTEIMTGAPLPIGADAVVKIEDVDVEKNAQGKTISIQIRVPLNHGENVRRKGSDFEVGQAVLAAGAPISPEHVLGFATLGVSTVKVWRRPKVAVVSTGNEIVEHSMPRLLPGMIRNSTGPYLLSALPLFGADAHFYGAVQDDPEAFQALMKKIIADQPDLILTTGAVSKGKLDFIPDSLRALGAQIEFHGVAIRPGKPLLFGAFENGPSIFSIPGNPVSTAIALRFFVAPYLRFLQGLPPEETEQVKLSNETSKFKGLRCFYKASIHRHLEGSRVTSLEGQESYRVSSLLPANAWLILDEADETISAGRGVQTLPLYPSKNFEEKGLNGGGCC